MPDRPGFGEDVPDIGTTSFTATGQEAQARQMGIEGALPPLPFDTSRKFVRVIERRPDGFVEFHFSIGDPTLFVEMFLTEAAFEEFCSENHTEPMGPADIDEWSWTMHDATHRRFQ